MEATLGKKIKDMLREHSVCEKAPHKMQNRTPTQSFDKSLGTICIRAAVPHLKEQRSTVPFRISVLPMLIKQERAQAERWAYRVPR